MSTDEATIAENTGPELRRLLAVVGSVVVVAALSYLGSGFERVRPWVPGEGVPIVRMFEKGVADALPAFAEAGMWTSDPEPDGTGLSGAVAAELGDPREAVSPKDDAAEDEPPPSPDAAPPALRVAPEEYAGVEQPIENASSLGKFFHALSNSAHKKPGAITRVAHYGDSAVAADAITMTARRKLQKRFGDAGHGFILVSRGNMHYGHKDIRHRASEGWEVHSLVHNSLRRAFYGYGGVQYRGRAGEWATFETPDDGPVGRKVSVFEIHYQRHKRGGWLRYSVDDDKREPIHTRADRREDAWERIEVPDGPHKLHVRAGGGGELRVYGVVFERDRPGVVYDSLGLVGARAQRLLNNDPEHIQRQIAHRRPDLLVLGFGGNEAGNRWLKIDRYEEELVHVVRTMRAGRKDMACLLFGPLDQGERDERGQLVTLETLPQIVDVQRRVAKAEGCAFFDTYQAMGGENSVAAWYKSRPRLITSDFRHATPKGYQVIGTMYYKALLKAFAEYLQKR